jgi:hypothetical protein
MAVATIQGHAAIQAGFFLSFFKMGQFRNFP